MKRIKTLIFALLLVVCGGVKVKAFDINSTDIDSPNIYFGSFVYAKENNPVYIDNDILTDQSKVYAYVIELTQQQFDTIEAKKNEVNAFITQCNNQLSQVRAESDALFEILKDATTNYNNDPSEENEAAYNTARANYDAKNEEYNNLLDQVNAQVDVKTAEYYELIPLAEGKFSEINVDPEVTATYATGYSYYYGNYEHGLVWAKVVNGSESKYNFAIITASVTSTDDNTTVTNPDDTNETTTDDTTTNDTNETTTTDDTTATDTTTIGANTENSAVENPKTGIYYGTGILVVIVLVGILSYVLVRRKSKFSRSC